MTLREVWTMHYKNLIAEQKALLQIEPVGVMRKLRLAEIARLELALASLEQEPTEGE